LLHLLNIALEAGSKDLQRLLFVLPVLLLKNALDNVLLKVVVLLLLAKDSGLDKVIEGQLLSRHFSVTEQICLFVINEKL
jgi:hypothetical protein